MSSSLYSGVSGLALGAGLYRSVSGLWGGASGLINGFGGGGPYDGASLYLNFLSMTAPTFDSRITFSRGSNATVVDSTGRVTYAPANLLSYSEAFSDGSWIKSGASVSGSVITATAGNSAHRIQKSSPAISSSIIFWVEAAAGTHRYIQLFNGASVNMFANFDLLSGVVGSVGSSASASITPLGGGRYRCAMVVSGASGPNNSHLVGMVTSAGSAWSESWNASGTENFTLYLAQLEPVTYQTTPSAYAATTSAAYYGPRFDHDPVTLAPRGLLVEEARTNLLTYSDALDNTTGWPTATNVTVTANVTASPDGTVNADRLDDGTTAAVQHRLFRSYTFTAAAHTLSIYAKAGTGAWFQLVVSDGTTTFYANFNVSTGVTGSRQASTTSTITNVGNGWYRCSMTMTTLAAAGNIQIGMLDTDQGLALPSYTGANRTLFFYGAQLEAGAFATSYIPTVASTVTRSADVATMTGANFSSWYNQSEGTFVAGFDVLTPANTANANVLSAYGSANDLNRIWMWSGAPNVVRSSVVSGGAASSELTGATAVANTPLKAAAAYKVNDFAFSTNGGSASTDTAGAVPSGVTLLGIGNQGVSTEYLNGHIREIAYFNTRQSNARLQTLTAPPLVTTLSLDFTSGTYLVGY